MNNLNLHPGGAQRLAGEHRGHHRVGCGAASGGIGQRRNIELLQKRKNGGACGVTAHGNGRHFGAGRNQRLLEQVHAGCASGAHDKAGVESAVADGEWCEAHEFSSVGTSR